MVVEAALEITWLPTLNACLNAIAACLLLWGRALIRRGAERAHRCVMTAAFLTSTLFLVSYVTHKVGRNFENTPFWGEGVAKLAYLAMLASHVILAMAVPVLAIALVVLALRGRRDSHRRLARWAWPIWMYVSVTGVAIYLLLYRLRPEDL